MIKFGQWVFTPLNHPKLIKSHHPKPSKTLQKPFFSGFWLVFEGFNAPQNHPQASPMAAMAGSQGSLLFFWPWSH
jgi:hypothetical protein